MIFLFKKEDIASDFSGCTGSFHTCCTCSDDYYITVFINFQFFINVSFRNGRVYGTADRTVHSDTVACTSDITRDTLTEHIFFTWLYFLYPVWFSNKTTSHSDDIYITALEYFFYNFRITVVSGVDYRFAEFIFYSSWHVGTPSIWKEVWINLILKWWIQSAWYIVHIYELIKIFKIL